MPARGGPSKSRKRGDRQHPVPLAAKNSGEKTGGLDDDGAVAILESIARDESAKPYERLQAIAQLDRRRRAAGAKGKADDEERPSDPMSDLDELAPRRARRAS